MDTEQDTDEITNTVTEQYATIRHLGGTLPFQLKIGNTLLDEMQGELDKDIDTKAIVSGWDPKSNNIEVTVKGQKNEGVKTIRFPKTGEVPMIIAVDPEVKWMSERTSIPETWWKEGIFK